MWNHRVTELEWTHKDHKGPVSVDNELFSSPALFFPPLLLFLELFLLTIPHGC